MMKLFALVENGHIVSEFPYDDAAPRKSTVLPIVVQTCSYDPATQAIMIVDTITDTQVTRQQVAVNLPTPIINMPKHG